MARTRTADGDGGPSVGGWLKSAALTGLTLIIPLVITIFVLTVVWGFIASLVTPLSAALAEVLGLTSQTERYLLLGLTTVGLGVLVVVIGALANATSTTGVEAAFDHAIESIPAIGGIYSTFNDMSELLLDSDSQSFQEVVLVEYPHEDTFCLAFLTNDAPDVVREAVDGGEMITVFMPMGPNPFMGGFVLHISEDRVYDVDMTVEEGIQSVVTSGAAIGEHDDASAPADLTAIGHGAPGTAGTGGAQAPIGDEDGRNGDEEA